MQRVKVKSFILFLVIIFSYAGLAFAQAQLSIDRKVYDLGKIIPDKIYKGSIVLKNTGDAPLIIKDIYGTCGCIEVDTPQQKILDPGQNIIIDFDFDSTGYIGKIEKSIYIKTNDPGQSFYKFPVVALVEEDNAKMINTFKSLGPLTIAFLGLVDSVNPCAITVLVFFVSFLSFVGYNRKELFLIGSLFIATVFTTYLVIGLGLLEFFRKLLVYEMLSNIFSTLIAVFAFALGIVSLYDFWIYKKTKDPDKIKLKLPGLVKEQIHKVIRDTTDIREKTGHSKKSFFGIITAAIVCGFLVTLLESVCTGQAYLPTIVFILKFGTMRLKAFLYLLLYNFMFVLPLLVIMFAGISGDRSQKLSQITLKHIGSVKIATAILFFALGFAIIFADTITKWLNLIIHT